MAATFTDEDGKSVRIVEPRVVKMLRAIASSQGEIAGIQRGRVELDFADAKRDIHVDVTRSRRQR